MDIARLALFFVPFLLALCVHEWAHGYVANYLGDPTAKLMGRLTLNPIAHADPLGTVVLPLVLFATGSPFFFGWAKPVPVNTRNLKNVRRDMFWVALAGPASNIFMALIGAFLLVIAAGMNSATGSTLMEFAQTFTFINLFLAVFNMIPVHPLDGAKVIAIFFPEEINRKLEETMMVQQLFLFAFIFTIGISILKVPVIFLFQTFTGIAGVVLGVV